VSLPIEGACPLKIGHCPLSLPIEIGLGALSWQQ
jgi:hypothetical protein